MAARENGRFGRLFGRDDATDGDETVALSGNDDHAWWADRRSLSGTPGSPTVGHPAEDLAAHQQDREEEQEEEAAASDWSVSALFADAGFDPAGTPPPRPEVDDGTTTILVTTGLDEARLVLGVDASSTWEEITKAHRNLAMQYHPDRLGALSLEAQELGQHRMAEINRAHDTLKAALQV